jgi:methylaspartate mutase epsilon subunit
MLAEQPILDTPEVQREKEIIRREVDCLLPRVLAMGLGDTAAGIAAAFEAGILDVPFAPSIHARGKLLPMRDNEGCIRIFNRGAVPLNDELVALHRERLEERARSEGRNVSFQMVTDDIYAVSKGRLVGRPR